MHDALHGSFGTLRRRRKAWVWLFADVGVGRQLEAGERVAVIFV